ncbi:MAG TPA: DUF1127 domain-containing protein [Azospirillum sp.]|nr:DUF1127 domain-containing protein [Azospirillum sp.]
MGQSTNTVFTRTTTRPANGLMQAVGRAVVGVTDTLATWQERRRQRRALEALPDHLLHDIGISRADAGCEADKPFWRG